MVEKAEGAFRTIGELSAELKLPQHILRYWESKFPQLKPMTRAGSRRYYRPDDVALVKRINMLLNHEGYTVKGVQKLLNARGAPVADGVAVPPIAPSDTVSGLIAIRDRLARAIAEDDVAARV
ncbi:MAG: MerR family transcriptional regulator [Chakrabartia sp.]